MKKASIWILTLFFMFVSASGILQAHKLEVNLTQQPPVVMVEAGFSGHHHGLSGGDVFIYAPGEAEKAFQTGKTDVQGKFAFIPTEAGEWKVVVDDGTGHRGERVIILEENFFSGEKAEPGSEELKQAQEPQEEASENEADSSQTQVPLLWKVLVGVSLLFGIAGILYGAKARQRSK
jgi:hypothetical protein